MTTATHFLEQAIACHALLFGEFITKAGRCSPYFFNAGHFASGAALRTLGDGYAGALLQHGVTFDMLFGPAYKGIPLVAATAIALATKGYDVPYAFNRKEAKDHGEGGVIVGAALQGKVVVVDDVVSAGTSVAQSLTLIEAAGAQLAAVLVALDRCEITSSGNAQYSATEEISRRYNVPVIAIANVWDLLPFASLPQQQAIRDYLQRYGNQVIRAKLAQLQHGF